MRAQAAPERDGWMKARLGSTLLPFALAAAGLALNGVGTTQDAARPPAYTITNLGTLRDGTSSGAEAINNRGEVVGSADTGPRVARLATKVSHAFLWKNGVMRDLGALVRGEPSGAGGINDAGEVVGDANGVRL